MLFVRDYYKQDENNKKKEISNKWKILPKEKRKKYNDRATELLKCYNKMINKEEKNEKKKKKIISVIETIEDKEIETIDYLIRKIKIEDKELYVDFHHNIIDIDNSKYIGYIDKNTNKIYYL